MANIKDNKKGFKVIQISRKVGNYVVTIPMISTR